MSSRGYSDSDTSAHEPTTDSELALKAHLKRLGHSIVQKPPYCQGTLTLPEDDFALYYGKGTNACHVDLANSSPEELQRLEEACDPATFGLGQQDVYDESYRKAGKLDASKFMLRFSPDSLGLSDIISTELLQEGREATGGPIHAELYKLNVYGPQSFFKSHVDTPRSELMFGSLVIVFPTPHEGGALVLREHKGEQSQEWTFDPAALLVQAARPSIAYVAFYSDIEHEVMPVQSGYRVTITYNLYRVKEDTAQGNTSVPLALSYPTNEGSLRETLRELLEDPSFLPEGGNLMFALRHQYPLSKVPMSRARGRGARKALQEVATRLKATDALVFKVMRELSLDASLKIVYEDRGSIYYGLRYVMCDRAFELESVGEEDEPLWRYLARAVGGVLLNPFKQNGRLDEAFEDSGVRVHWVAPVPWSTNAVKTTYMAYGNQAEIAYTYWKISLFVRVGSFGNRATASAS